MLTYIQLDIYIRIFPTRGACQMIKWKRERWRSPWLLHKVRHKVKDRPFTEGSRGCHVLLGLDAQNLNAKERHFILPLVIWTFIMHSVAFYFFHITRSYKAYFLQTNQSYIFWEQFLLLAPMTTYLKDLTQSIGRYGGLSWQNWV